MRTRLRCALLLRAVLASLVAAILLSVPGRLLAHPMGNFSISHYAGITVERGFIELRYLLDFAEIPAFQELQQSGVNPQANDSQIPAYLAAKSADFARGLHLTVNGRALDLRDVGHSVIFPPGAGNLPTMKFGFIYRADLPADCTPAAPCQLEYDDANFAARAGWKEVVAEAAAGAVLVSSTVPAKDRSLQLSNYPTDLLNSPPQVLRAAVTFTIEPAPAATSPRSNAEKPDARTAAPSSTTESLPSIPPIKPNEQATPRNAFTELMGTKEISFSVAWVAAIIAMGLGALHAFEPGHGKTIVAAYLVGGKGTARHAIFLGTIVTLSHTSGVYLLGAVTLYAQKYIVPDQLYPFLGVLSGLLIAGMGLYLFLQRYAGKPVLGHSHDHSHTHSHGPFSHAHSHEHGAGHVHAHDHAPPDVHHDHVSADHDHADSHDRHHADEKPSIAQLLILGITGGIVPCPAALVVLLSAVALHRVGFGLFLIVAFSLGLAAVLIAMGLIAVYARRLMSRVPAEGPLIQRWLPLTSAAMITILGCVIAVRGLIAAGIVQIRL